MALLTFRALSEFDLPQLSGWLAAAHVQQWWRDGSNPERVREKYLPRIHGHEPTEVFVIVSDDQDIGIIQRYRFRDYPEWDGTIAGTGLSFRNPAGMDYLIGLREQTGRGVGARAVRAFTELVFGDYPDVDEIVATPQHDNRASCRVLEKAGYELRWTGHLESNDPADQGRADLYVRPR